MATARHPKATYFVQRQLFAGLTSFAGLESKIAALPDEQSRGAAFEVFAEAYLATQRKHDAAQVWPHGSVPLDILKNLGLTQQDQGVDGVLQTLLGQLNAYQVKFRTGRPSLTWRELSTFIGLADSPHIHSRVLLTNCDELPAVLNDRQGFFCIRDSDLDRLEAGDFRAMEAWLADAAFIAPKKSPQPHQTEALDALLPALQTHDRVSAIMACGTGKTLVALWVMEKLVAALGSREATPRKLASYEVAGNAPANFPRPEGTPDFHRPVRTDSVLDGEPDTSCLANFQSPAGTNAAKILILLPSLALLRQTLHEWLRETRLPGLAYLCVCSDPTVKEGIDALTTQQSDLDFQVSTDTASVRSFLDAHFAGVKMIFSTYQSASVVGAAMKPGEAFDLAVFDEAHKTAGREGRNFALALDDKNLSIRKRLFLTATPRHYNPLAKNKDGGAQLVFSMDKPEVYGPIVYRLPFSEAAKRGIISDYKIIISEVTSDMVNDELLRRGIVLVEGEEIKARQVANQIALKSAIKLYNVSKVFTFHSRVDAAKSFTSDGAAGISTHLQGFHCAHIEGAMPTAFRERVMRVFKSAAHAILSNARCLTEGVDVPAVDMVAFLAPRRSMVDIVQATGRAMRRSPGKQFGYVLVPLYVEKTRGETVEQAVLRSNFDEIWKVLQALKEQDDLLSQIIDDMRIQRGRTGGFDDSRFRERVEMLGPEISLDSLRQSITAACLDAIGEGWFERYGQLLAYQQKHGNQDMPARWPQNQKLATWVVNQRVLKRDGVLEDEKIALLDRVGFKWSPHESKWRTYYLDLLKFRERFGNCRVPQNWEEDEKLARWVSAQRLDYGRGDLSRERITKLESIGFDWSVGKPTWEGRFADLCAYKERFGNTLVPVKWKEDPLLGRWVSAQRYKGNQGEMSKEHKALLNSIGFEWKAPSALPPTIALEDRIEYLLAHKAEHGHLAVSQHDNDYAGLADWMTQQRRRLKNGTLQAEIKKRLDEIDFPWTPAPPKTDKQWFEMFEQFKEYAASHGASTVRKVDDKTAKLNSWMLTQRQKKKFGKLSEARIKALDEIGFAWERVKKMPVPKQLRVPSEPKTPPRNWEEMFRELINFYKLQGHCNVPVNWHANPELASWVAHQRIAKRQNWLTADQLRRMDEVGFAWSIYDGDWDAMFSKLVEHLRPMHNGKLRDVAMSGELRSWTLTQRQFKKRGELDIEREKRLTSIGFEWEPFSAQWEAMFGRLRAYHAKRGNCLVPSKWPEDQQLASWVGTQRMRKSEGKLSAERIAKLDTLKFEWRPRRSGGSEPVSGEKYFETMFEALLEYKQGHGDCLVPQRWKENRKLAEWVSEQRMAYSRERLAPDRVRRLDEVGFEWDPVNTRWEEMFQQLVEFKKEHNHTNVAQRSGKYKELGTWVRNQRGAKRDKRPIMVERSKRLDEIGFVWRLVERNAWEKMFDALVEYKKAHNHCNVPQKAGEYKRLGKWVNSQRTANFRGKITPARKQQLNSIGFVWNLRPNLAAAR